MSSFVKKDSKIIKRSKALKNNLLKRKKFNDKKLKKKNDSSLG